MKLIIEACIVSWNVTEFSQGDLHSFITLLLTFIHIYVYKFRNIRCVFVICTIIQECSAK
jgi:hypothetical protein